MRKEKKIILRTTWHNSTLSLKKCESLQNHSVNSGQKLHGITGFLVQSVEYLEFHNALWYHDSKESYSWKQYIVEIWVSALLGW